MTSTVTDMASKRRGAKQADGEETGVVDSDHAEDTPPEPAPITEAEVAKYHGLVASGVADSEARIQVWPEHTSEQLANVPRPTPPMQIPLPGIGTGLNDVAGGTMPTSSEARILGGSLPIDGQFAGEERVTLVVEAIVSEVHVVYTTDDWGATKAVKRRHRMRMLSVRKA